MMKSFLYRSNAHIGGRFFSAILFLVSANCSATELADIQPYLYTDAFARSEPISVMDTLHGWKGEHQRGEKQYIYSWFETGAKLNNWGLGVLYRRDYALNFSGDTAELYGAVRNNENLPIGRTYDVNLKAHAITAKGLRLSWENEWQPTFKTTVGLSFLQGSYLIEGNLNGTATATGAKEYEYNANVDYAYSDDLLFDRVLTEQLTGYGGALDFAFDWHPTEQWHNHTEVKDLLAAIWWKDAPYTQAVAYSDRQHTSSSGYTTWAPLISGTEKNYGTYRQTLPLRFDTQWIYQTGRWQYGAGLQYQFKDYVPRLGAGQQIGQWQVFAWYRPIDQSIELTTNWNKLELGFGMDNMRWDDAKFIHIRVAYAY
ncbi:hypothetical protein [Tolumonas lignilytica]|jgi:hypothetical protein|uniref:hypothetical protein n=1 Tax=Tolumonas lignilytica TaxID=1283284 RepID=UPI0004677774|nr:hypothetical protein [Tolumonas lignilytica]